MCRFSHQLLPNLGFLHHKGDGLTGPCNTFFLVSLVHLSILPSVNSSSSLSCLGKALMTYNNVPKKGSNRGATRRRRYHK